MKFVKRMISVIVPFFNANETIKRCIDSIIKQSYRDFELILIDDGSTDNSYEICSKYKSNNIHILKKKHLGVSAARNAGLEYAKGEYISFCDADDIYCPDFLEKMIQIERSTRADIVISGYYAIDDKNNKLVVSEKRTSFFSEDEIINNIILNNNIGGFCWNKLFKNSCIENLRFPTELTHCEDLYFFLGAVKNASLVFYSPDPLICHYYNEKGASEDFSKIISKSNRSQFSIAIEKILRDFTFSKVSYRNLLVLKSILGINYLCEYLEKGGDNKYFIKNMNQDIVKTKRRLFCSNEIPFEQKKQYLKSLVKIELYKHKLRK